MADILDIWDVKNLGIKVQRYTSSWYEALACIYNVRILGKKERKKY